MGDGADIVRRDELDAWQKFAYDVVMDARHKVTDPLRLMLLGTAGTGKSRTIRSFVHAIREGVRETSRQALDHAKFLALERAKARRSGAVSTTSSGITADNVAMMLGVARSDVDAYLAAEKVNLERIGENATTKSAKKAEAAYNELVAKFEERVRNSCVLAAPTGCASFQLRYGASTLHRVFGIPVGFCGKTKDLARAGKRFLRMKTRMTQARTFVMDEMSMIGRKMLGKIEFKVGDILKPAQTFRENGIYLAGKNAVLAGDPKQAAPIGDDPMYREGAYDKKGENKPKGSDRTPGDAWSNVRLTNVGMDVRNSFQDCCFLRQVHRHSTVDDSLPPERQKAYRDDAERFLQVMKGMAELTWSREDHSWLAKRNRRILQQTQEGRAELRSFDDAPLLMDGRVDTVSGAVGANRINRLKLEQVSADTKKPILSMGAYYTTPKTEKGQKMEPSLIGAEDFRGMEDMVLLCEGARVLLTQNLWVEAGLMNGALGYVRGFMFPQGFDPSSKEKELQAPICVFIEFDSVNLGTDADGNERSFFPNDPEKKKWIPIFSSGGCING